MTPKTRQKIKEMEAEIDRGARREMGIPDDWTYRDVPWCGAEWWNKLISLIGTEDHKLIVRTQRGSEVRGQMFVSPVGLRNLADYLRSGVN